MSSRLDFDILSRRKGKIREASLRQGLFWLVVTELFITYAVTHADGPGTASRGLTEAAASPPAQPAPAETPAQAQARAEEDKTKRLQAEAAAAKKADDERAENARCAQDLQCLANKHDVGAAVRCRRPVENMAKYDFKWTDGWLEVKFPSIRWVDQKRGVIGFFGDKIMFQNGFGAFKKMRYQCDYNALTDVVENVHVYDDD